MTTPSTAIENAKAILSIFSESGGRSGTVIPANKFHKEWKKLKLLSDDFYSGMEYATQQGWIEVTAQGSFQLTDAGFSAL